MRQRLLLGPVLIAVLVGLILLDQSLAGMRLNVPGIARDLVLPPGLVVLGVTSLMAVLAAAELAAIFAAKSVFAPGWLLMFAAFAGLWASSLPAVLSASQPVSAGNVVAALAATAAVVLAGAVLSLSRGHTTKGVAAGLGGVFLAFIYLGLLFSFTVLIRVDFGAWLLLWALLSTKLCDIGAYFTGKALGRHKLIPWLSPGKTQEGLVGGVCLAAIGAAVGAWAIRTAGLGTAPPVGAAAAAGAVFGLVGQAGDLMASLLKRDAGLKDSGHVLPGFGGILDVIDSPLLVLPVAYWWLHAVG